MTPLVAPATLRRSRAQVVGAGALGWSVLAVLARAGVGALVLDDAAEVTADEVDAGLYPPGSAGRLRALVARPRLLALRPGLRVEAPSSAGRPDVLVCAAGGSLLEASAARARALGVTLVAAGAQGERGWVLVAPVVGPCAACAAAPLPAAPPLPPAPGVAEAAGALAAFEALALLGGAAATGRRTLLDRGAVAATLTAPRTACELCSAG